MKRHNAKMEGTGEYKMKCMPLMKSSGEKRTPRERGSNVSDHGVGDKDDCRRRAVNQYVANSATSSEKKEVKMGQMIQYS